MAHRFKRIIPIIPKTKARRALLIAAVLLASTAVLGFSQASSAPSGSPGHPSEPGVVVVSVEPGSPADKAGVARGDIILDVAGTAVNTQIDVRKAVVSHKEGDTVSLKVRHGDSEKTVSVALGGQGGRAYLGVLLFPEGRERMAMRGPGDREWPWTFSEGALVARVAPGGPAEKAGLRKGDLILSVDGIAVDQDHALGSLIQEKKTGDTVTLSVRERGPAAGKAPRELKVTLGASPETKKPWLGVEYMMGFPTAQIPMPRAELPPASL